MTVVYESLQEFEYDSFSIFHDIELGVWYLECIDTTDGGIILVIIEDLSEGLTFEESENLLLDEYGFTQEDFLGLKKLSAEKLEGV